MSSNKTVTIVSRIANGYVGQAVIVIIIVVTVKGERAISHGLHLTNLYLNDFKRYKRNNIMMGMHSII